jgi:FlaG/FlaF family flagellin (archaellin)
MYVPMLGKKAVSEVVSVVLVLLIGISLAGTAYMWGMPIITKQQDTTTVERTLSYFDRSNSNSLVRKIEFVAKNGGEDTFTSDVSGGWLLHEYNEAAPENNSLEFEIFSKVSNIAIANETTGIDWVALTAGGSCPPESGFVGFDPPGVVCAKAEPFTNGFNLIYRISFRELYESTGMKGHKIRLVKDPSGQISSSSKTIRIAREQITTQEQDGKTLIITEIKILLI